MSEGGDSNESLFQFVTSERPHFISVLPIVTTCDGCGACCMEQGAPPDYIALRVNPHFADDPSFADDVERLRNLPAEASSSLDAYLAIDRALRPTVCVWFDADLRQCRHYDHRPSTCRVFELNGPGCHIYRRRHDIGAVG
jgi:Fe-S-cluster containining protein